MVLTIYKEALAKLMEKPLKLWGLSLLYVLLVSVGSALFGIIPGVAIAIGVLFETAMALIFLRGYRCSSSTASATGPPPSACSAAWAG